MNLFNYKKKSKVAYTFWGGEEARALFKPPEIINSKHAGCPAMYGIRDRLVGLYPPMSIDLTIYNDGELRYEYELNQKEHTAKPDMHTFVKNNILLEQAAENLYDVQLFLNICFITDDPELELITLPPHKMKTKNADYVQGMFVPYSWVRPLNSVWYVDDGSKVRFDVNEPATFVFFNKPIELEYRPNEGKIKEFIKETKNITSYKKGTTKVFPHVLSRRPKKLL